MNRKRPQTAPNTRIPSPKIKVPNPTPSYHCRARPRTCNSGSPGRTRGCRPPVFGLVPAVPRDGRPRGVPVCAWRPGTRHSRNAAGTHTSDDVAHRPLYRVVGAVSWDGARQTVAWSPCEGCPLDSSGAATHLARTRGHRSHRSQVAHLTTTHEKPPCNTWWREVKQTVHSPILCLHRECRLRHSPTVVARSSLYCRCTGTRGK